MSELIKANARVEISMLEIFGSLPDLPNIGQQRDLKDNTVQDLLIQHQIKCLQNLFYNNKIKLVIVLEQYPTELGLTPGSMFSAQPVVDPVCQSARQMPYSPCSLQPQDSFS